jgi:hypothetical protein
MVSPQWARMQSIWHKSKLNENTTMNATEQKESTQIAEMREALEQSTKLLKEIITGKHRGSKEGTLCHRQIALNELALRADK